MWSGAARQSTAAVPWPVPKSEVKMPKFCSIAPTRRHRALCIYRVDSILLPLSPRLPCLQVRVVRPGNVQAQLEEATDDYIREHVCFDEASRTVTISRLLHWYSRDFARTMPDLVLWALQRLPPGQVHDTSVVRAAISGNSLSV